MTDKTPARTITQYLAAFSAAIGAFLIGISIGWTSPVQSQIEYNEDNTCDYKYCVTSTQFTWIATCLSIGTVITSPFAGVVMNKIGRKFAMIAFIVPLATGWVSITTASSAVPLYIGRLLLGAAGACFTMTITVYVAEISSPEIRGRLSTLLQVLVNVGAVYTYITGYFFTLFWMNVACSVIVIVYFVALLFIPESPRYDISKSKLVKAKKSLIYLRGIHYDVDHEIQTILTAQNEIKNSTIDTESTLKKLLFDPINLKTFLIVMGLVFAFQMSGINVILFYVSGILEQANVNIDPNLAAIIVGMVFISTTFVAAFLVDRLGRRPLLILSTGTLALSLFCMGVYFLLQENGTLVDSLTWIPIVILSVFVSAHSLGIGPITWLIMGEVLEQSVKDVATGIAVGFCDLLSIVSLLLFPYLTGSIGDGWTFIVFSVFTILSFIFIIFFVPETKGRTLEEIQWMLRKKR